MILGLDLGTTTGWAIHHEGAVIASGVWRLPEAQPDRAYLALSREIEARLPLHPEDCRRITLIAYESVPAQAHHGGDAAHRWGGFEGVLLAECARGRCPYVGVKPARWKKTAGLRSGTGPRDALAAARKRWPQVEFSTPDEAVARWVAIAAAQTYPESRFAVARTRATRSRQHPGTVVESSASIAARSAGERTAVS